jgi:hypothetical protein
VGIVEKEVFQRDNVTQLGAGAVRRPRGNAAGRGDTADLQLRFLLVDGVYAGLDGQHATVGPALDANLAAVLLDGGGADADGGSSRRQREVEVLREVQVI